MRRRAGSGTVTRIGTARHTVRVEACKVIASRYGEGLSGADVLDEPGGQRDVGVPGRRPRGAG